MFRLRLMTSRMIDNCWHSTLYLLVSHVANPSREMNFVVRHDSV